MFKEYLIMWSTLTNTGGSWKIKSVVHGLVTYTFPEETILSNENTAAGFFSAMREVYTDSSLRNTQNKEFFVICDSLISFYSGKINENQLSQVTHSVLRKVQNRLEKQEKQPNASSELSIIDDSEKKVVLVPARLEKDPRKWRTRYKTVSHSIYVMVILFFVLFSSTVSAQEKTDLVDSAVNNLDTYISTGEENIYLPPSFTPKISSGNTLMNPHASTPFLKDLDSRLLMRHKLRRSREQDELRQDVDHFLVGTEKVFSSPEYEIYTKGVNDDEFLNHVTRWTDYMQTVLNPVYTPSDTPLKFLLGDVSPKPRRGIEGDEDYKYIGGEYQPDTNTLFVRLPKFSDDPIVKKNQMMEGISTVVHELSHRAHLENSYVALDCRKAYAGKLVEDKNEPGLCRAHGHQIDSNSSREYLMTIRDAVEEVLYLGIPNEAISYEEALVYNKMILDMRVQIAYENALENKEYDIYMRKYGMSYALTNHMEFWAQASTSYLYTIHERQFPDRSWIEENDPVLYELLGEIYQSAPEFIVENDSL